MKRLLLYLVAIVVLLAIWYGESRKFFCLDKGRCVTVWKTFNDVCYIIPGKYYGLLKPAATNYIQTTNLSDVNIIWQRGSADIIVSVDGSSKIFNQSSDHQGLAAEEITRLEAVHVHLREGRLFVRAMKRTGQRWLPLSALQLIELGEYMQDNKLKTGPLLVTGRKQRVSPTNINNRMQGMIKQLRRLNPRVINAA